MLPASSPPARPAPRAAARHLRPARITRLALAALGVLPLPACGPSPAPAEPLVELVTSPLDGAAPREGLVMERAEPGAPRGSYALTPVPGRPGVFEARGAPRGGYLLRMPPGWGMLGTNRLAALQPDGIPAPVHVGRSHTLYLLSHRAQRPLGATWALRRSAPPEERGQAIPVRVEQEPGGQVLIRVPPEQWRGALELQGRFADGGLVERWPFFPGEHGLPILRRLEPEPLAPLLVPVAGAPVEGGLWVTARVLGLPLPEEARAPVREGAASFPGLPTTGEQLELVAGDEGSLGALRLPPGGWFDEGEVRLHARPAGARVVLLPLPSGAPPSRCQVAGPTADAFGLVPFRTEQGRLAVELAPGAWRLLLTQPGAHVGGQVEVPEAGEATVVYAPSEPDAVVRGVVTGGDRGRVVFERLETGAPRLAHGFVASVRTGGSFVARLPPGPYRLTVETARGARDGSRTFHFAPGEQRSLSLEAPR